ncbi:MAG TPA: MFS transporter [Bryobacteraceae bacterium]|nr:MFS transporter [Bryobacteraceae bacterium]
MTATRVRYRVVAAAVALAGVTYLDRVCVGVLAPSIMADLRITPVQMSFVFSAFTAAYALFEMPTAWWADRIGSRRVLTRIVLWWSAFTMLTAAATSYAVMLAVRFLFGAGEAGAWPNAARVFSRWIPLRERGRVQGVFFAGAHLAGGLTPGLVTLMALYLPWRTVFLALGFVGLAWAAFWYRWFRDEPRDHPSVNAAEADLIETTRGLPAIEHAERGHWTEVFRIPSLIPLCLQYVANSYGYYFFITWLPTYLAKARGMSSAELAIFSGLPLTLSAIADVTGGFTTDAMSRRLGVRNGTRGIGVVSYVLAAAAMLAGTLASSPRIGGTLIAVGGAFSMFTLAPSWSTAIGLGGRNTALLSSVMNTSGQVGAFFSPLVLAFLVDRTGDWSLPLHVLSGLYLIAAICWLLIRPKGSLA